MKTLKLSIVTLSFLILSACGGGSDDPDELPPRGVFIDSAVEGVTYTTATQSGTTDSAGTFTYLPGEVVSFYIGDILIGSAEGQAMLTPLDFVPGAVDETDPQVTNILRFVQSLDSDNDPDNGITISAATAAAAIGQSLDFSASNVNFVADAEALLTVLTAGAVNTLIDASTAQAHFVASIGGTVTASASAGILTIAGTDTGLFGTSLDADSTLTAVTPLGVDSAVVQWRQNLAGGAFFQVAVTYVSGVIYDVLFTWQDGGSAAAYAISCPANPAPAYAVGDCSLMALDLTAQQVTFDVSIVVEPSLNINGTAPITVNGVLDFTIPVTPPGSSAGILTLAGTDTGLFGTSLDADSTLTAVTPLGVDSAVVQWRQNLAGGAFFQVAVTYVSGVIYDVLFTWQDGGSAAAYAISCPANPAPAYAVGDCSLMALDLTAQQVTFDVSIVVEPSLNINGTAPITVNGVLDFTIPVTPPGSSAGILTLAGTDTGLFGTSLDADSTLTAVTPLGVDSAVVQWRQNLAGGAFFQVAVTYVSGVIYDVLFTWQDGGSAAAYAISCPANLFPSYTVGDCSLMALDLTAQQVTFDVSIVVEPSLNINGTAPITVNGVLDF